MADSTLLSPEVEEEGGGRRAMDPEILTLQRIIRLMEELTEPRERARVMAYLVSRFAPEIVDVMGSEE